MTTHDTVAGELADIVTKNTHLANVELKSSATLEELGLDSLDIVTIAFEIERIFKIELDQAAFQGVKTYGEFIDHVRARLQNG